MLGLVGILLVRGSGFGRYAMVLLSAHMVQHMMLNMYVPIPLVLTAPVTLALPAGRGRWSARGLLLQLLHSRPLAVLSSMPVAVRIFVLGLGATTRTSGRTILGSTGPHPGAVLCLSEGSPHARPSMISGAGPARGVAVSTVRPALVRVRPGLAGVSACQPMFGHHLARLGAVEAHPHADRFVIIQSARVMTDLQWPVWRPEARRAVWLRGVAAR